MTTTLEPPRTSPEQPLPKKRRRVRRPRPAADRARRTTPTTAATPSGSDTASAVLSSAFTMIAIVCLWIAVQMLFLGTIQENRSQDLLYAKLRTQLAELTAPIGPVVPVDDPVALLTIPSIGVEQVVVEGTASGDLLLGPGHRRDTPLPGQVGTSVIYGRATTYGGPFGDITSLRPGDPIKVVGAQGPKTFEVVDVRRAGDPLPQPVADGAARLTLVTAEGSGRLGAITPDTVVYVDADAAKGYPAPSGRPVAVPDSEKAMANEPGAVPLLALCLALLLASTLGVVAARQRWSAVLVWVVAAPLVIALSWASTDVVMRLLPNLI
ncbi:sortase [Nocardioides sp.]|uniref:sortase n=1 Tax=Nocardioides sp. TaxID=35761 RepID=UPI0037834E13